MSNLPENTAFQQWADQFAQMMANKTFELIEAQTKQKGGQMAALYVAMAYLAKFVGIMMLNTLNKKPDTRATKEETCNKTIANAADAKSRIQDAVAAGFQGAMKTFSGKEIEYYCQVRPVPQPANKKDA